MSRNLTDQEFDRLAITLDLLCGEGWFDISEMLENALGRSKGSRKLHQVPLYVELWVHERAHLLVADRPDGRPRQVNEIVRQMAERAFQTRDERLFLWLEDIDPDGGPSERQEVIFRHMDAQELRTTAVTTLVMQETWPMEKHPKEWLKWCCDQAQANMRSGVWSGDALTPEVVRLMALPDVIELAQKAVAEVRHQKLHAPPWN